MLYYPLIPNFQTEFNFFLCQKLLSLNRKNGNCLQLPALPCSKLLAEFKYVNKSIKSLLVLDIESFLLTQKVLRISTMLQENIVNCLK